MTTTCRVCGREIARRQIAPGFVRWGHTTNPRNEHHPAQPPRKLAPEADTETRAAWGDK
jgi:hypothetical protein